MPAHPLPEVGGSAKPSLGMGSRIQRRYQYDRPGQLSQIFLAMACCVLIF